MPSSLIREKIVASAKTLVIKVGTNVLADSSGRLNTRLITSLSNQVCRLKESGKNVVVVSSGAIGAGIGMLELPGRPKELAKLQAAAAVGQGKLMQLFEKGLAKCGLHAGQVLLTRSDFEDRRRYVNIERTLEALNHLGAIPIINENDTVAVDEIRFGDNDLIATLVANMVRADLLVILTVVEGLLDKNGERVDFVPAVGEEALGLLRSEKSTLGTGGMRSKLQSVKMATCSGIDTIIAGGREPNILTKIILEGQKRGTVFAGSRKRVSGRRSWIALAAKPMGSIVVDEGAARAIISGGKSLLPSGITAVTGTFERDDVVSVTNSKDQVLARGLSNYSAADLRKIKGRKSGDIAKILPAPCPEEAIHRDNLIVTSG
jgi:glutamate 5-kinase